MSNAWVVPPIIFGVMIFVMIANASYSYEYQTEQPMLSLNDGSQMGGSFLLGTGYVGSYPVFYTYVGTHSDGYYLKTFHTYNTKIYMDTNSPYVRSRGIKSDFIYHHTWEPNQFELHVPPGTIIQQYILDGKL